MELGFPLKQHIFPRWDMGIDLANSILFFQVSLEQDSIKKDFQTSRQEIAFSVISLFP